jgi:hypothetical protein
MSKFIRVVEQKYSSELILNIDNIVAIDRNVIHTNTVHGEGTGMFQFDEENINKILEAIGLATQSDSKDKQ